MPSKRLRALSVACVSLVFAWAPRDGVAASPRAERGVGVAVGRPAPPFVVARPDGTGAYALAMYRGRPLAITVFAEWCANCHREAPDLASAFAAYRSRVAFLGIDEQESASRARAFAREGKIRFPIAIDDGQFAATYASTQIPQTIFVDRHGIVRSIRRGLLSARELDADLARIAAAAP